MLVLLLAENGSIKSLGPVAAIGVACVLLAGLTLLPGDADDRRPARLLAAQADVVAYDPEQRHQRAARAAGGASATASCSGPAWRSRVTTAFFGVGALGPARLQGGLQHHRRSSRRRPRASTASSVLETRTSRPARCRRRPCSSSARTGPVRAGRRRGRARSWPHGIRASRPSRRASAALDATGSIAPLRRDLRGRPVHDSARSTSVTDLRDRAGRASPPGVNALIGGGQRDPVRLSTRRRRAT